MTSELYPPEITELEAARASEAPRARLVTLSDVTPSRVKWLWPGLIPLGKITILDGDPGLGKSTAMLDIAARVTTGRPMPDGSPGVEGSVILLSAEDDPSDTIRPRLEAARADLSRVHLLSAIQTPEGERLPELPLDLPCLKEAISQNVAPLASLVVIDPLMAFLGGDVNSHRDQDIRRALAPLKKLAEDTGAAIVIVRHLNKAIGGDPLYRGGGSIGIIGAARSGLLVAKDPEDETRRVLAMTKSNLAALMPALGFRIVEHSGAIALDWLGKTTHTAASLLAAPQDEEERSQLGEAKEFLAQELSDGRVPADEIGKLARKAAISERTLKRAKAALGVKSKKEGFEGIWYWSLPEKVPRGPSSMPWGSGPLRGETAAEGVRADHPPDLGPLREGAERSPEPDDRTPSAEPSEPEQLEEGLL